MFHFCNVGIGVRLTVEAPIKLNRGRRMDEEKEPGVITGQLELLELHLIGAKLAVREAQTTSLFRPCKLGKLEGCAVCKAKRWILRKRYT